MLGEAASDQNEKKERFREALQYFNRALVISEKFNLKATESLVLNNIGVLNIQIENFKEGLRFCHEAEKIAKQTGEILRKQEVYDCLYVGYKELNQNDKALKYLEQFKNIKDSLFSREALKRANQLQFERELAYREAIQQAELEKERALSEIKNKQQQYKIIILIVLLGLALFIVFLLIRQRRKTIQNYREIVRKNVELMKSEAELHVFKEKEKSDEFDLAALEVKNKEQKLAEENIDETELKEPKLNISEEQSSLLLNKINILLYKEKIYLDYELTLSSLADKLNSNTTYVSRIINDSFGKNFSAVISEFRVKEARKMLADPKFNNLTIEGIARETGFRSMPSFNRAFKSYTGVSPSFFKQTAQEGLDKPEEVD
jgi:AraC-like DNA-binding protein